jgi:hydroxymethylglutaryl-CoA reductase (NADPH)
MSDAPRIPRSKDNDYSEAMATERRDFIERQTGASLKHIGHYNQSEDQLAGNIENFFGVAQMPLGLAGPMRVNGEHAQGDFYVPMATTEGTLVASYSRGMKVLNACGGVTTTVVEKYMQRSPVFSFANARQSREFGAWIIDHFDGIKAQAETTTRIGKLSHIEQYQVGRLRYLRFNYTTGDAAGQNMVGKATLAACEWIRDNYPEEYSWTLSGNIDTDKKHSQMNLMHSRGTRVVAEATIPNAVIKEMMGVDTRTLYRQRQMSNIGAMMAHAANNGAHAANGIAAVFIATGQDEANVAESHAGLVYTELLDNEDYYWSITLPSLIVATYGGGTGLGTQRESLEMLGCYGQGKANKLAEIIAATVLAGDVSLSSAILAGDWVSSHDRLGRNRP